MKFNNLLSLLLTLPFLLLVNCANSNSKKSPTNSSPQVIKTYEGKASWYSIKTNYGTKTASGKPLQNHASTAAHKTLPLGTKVKVTNLRNGKSEIVTITDRGPYIKGRIIDVTIGVAERLNFVRAGVIPVKVEVLASKRS